MTLFWSVINDVVWHKLGLLHFTGVFVSQFSLHSSTLHSSSYSVFTLYESVTSVFSSPPFAIADSPTQLRQDFIFTPHHRRKLGSIFGESAHSYYRDEGRRIKTRVEKKTINSPVLNIRYCFKVAVYAEFRREWGEALRFYEDAFHMLREMIGTSTRLPPIQRVVEIKTVAELLHFKISTVLLHGGKLKEAVAWFRQHNASYRKLVGAPEVVFLHWEWISGQFL